MERKIGDTFEYQGKTFVVKKVNELTCKGCYFQGRCGKEVRDITGECDERTDKECVIFVEADKAPGQPAPEEGKKLNLLEVLKYCPEGTELWSPLLGNVRFSRLEKGLVYVKSEFGTEWDFNPDTTITFRFNGSQTQTSQEPMIFPSKEQRDWSKAEYPESEVLPKTWEDFLTRKGYSPDEFSWEDTKVAIWDTLIIDENDIDEQCKKHIAMIKLHALRDCYRHGWKPDDNECWCIVSFKNGELGLHPFATSVRFLSFGSVETASMFLNRFRGIIKEAGDLI